MSAFGHWEEEDGLPVFVYDADPDTHPAATWDPIVAPETNRHWNLIGNRRITAVVDNFGTVALFDESDGLRWLTASEPAGTGTTEIDGTTLRARTRRFGPTWFTVEGEAAGVAVTKSVLCPDGEQPWVLIHVRLENLGAEPRLIEHTERWDANPKRVDLFGSTDDTSDDIGFEQLQGPVGPLQVGAGDVVERWYRFGILGGSRVDDPEGVASASRAALVARLPRASSAVAPEASREVPWHAALLSGGACSDRVLGGHTLNQASAYSYMIGFNGAARDPLQHALPLVYSEPDLALSVLLNTCAWASPDGDLPYALSGTKRPWTSMWQPSDQNLWALWLASEYAAATGDLGAFSEPANFHPSYETEAVTLAEHLRRQFTFFVEGVGFGEHGHVRIRNADWNDMAITTSGVDHAVMIEKGESVLNSAMAAWVLPVYAGLCDRLGDEGTAQAARDIGKRLRETVAAEWNGRWFRRAYGPGRGPIGDDDCWLEVQPWAILCGAATDEQAEQLLRYIDEGPRAGSPLGARVRWPVQQDDPMGGAGEGTNGGVWYSINMTLVWAARRLNPELALDEWRRMTTAAHAAAYPAVWEGTLSGPDSYNAPESPRAGRTWASEALGMGMQGFPVSNMHSHAQPLLAYLRLLGVEPTADGALSVAGGPGDFTSQVFTIDGSGGRLVARGPVVLDTPAGRITGGPGEVRW